MFIRKFQSEIARLKTRSPKFYVILHLRGSQLQCEVTATRGHRRCSVTAAVWIQQCMVLVVWDNAHYNVVKCCSMCEAYGNNTFHSLVQLFVAKKQQQINDHDTFVSDKPDRNTVKMPLYIISVWFVSFSLC